MKGFWLRMILLLGCVHSLSSQIIQVPADYPTIQSGIDRAEPGDTVLVAEGIYFENINFMGKAITLASDFLVDGDTSHIFRTIINASRYSDPVSASVVTLDSGEDTTSVLCGFTIRGGRGTYIPDIIVDTAVKSTKYMVGGGILVFRSGAKIISNIIEENILISPDSVRGSMGAGIFAEVSKESELIIRNNIIRNNHIHEVQGWGGGMGILRGKILLEHNVIMNNSISAEWLSVGGGVFFQNVLDAASEREVVIRNNVISRNTAISHDDQGIGGGLAIGFIHEPGMMKIHHNLICNNQSNGIGGGLYSFDARGLLSENLIFKNSAGIYGSSIATEMDHWLSMDFNHIWVGDIWIATHWSNHKLKLAEAYGKEFVPHRWNGDVGYSEMFSIDPSTGGLYIGEPEGFISFRPRNVPLNAFAPPVILFDFRNKLDVDSPTAKNRIILSTREDYPKFKFAVLEYDHTCLLQYTSREYLFRYFMKGVDRDTIVTGMERTEEYLDMKPGRYSFWVTHGDPDGNWSPEAIEMEIIMRTPWYRSALAFGAYAFLLIFLLSVYIRFRTRRLRREKILLKREVARQTRVLQEKNEQVVEMERLRTRFFTDVSHEIRTPLSLITGPLDHLIQQDYPNPRIHYWLSLIKRNSQKLLAMVNQLLDISRIDAGHMKMVLEHSDVIGHVGMVANEFQSLAESKGIRYLIDIPDRILEVYYDRDKVEKVITNLLSNAFRFTPPGGIVTCRAKVLSGNHREGFPQLRVIVADTGPGVPAMNRERIFERFFTGRAESNEAQGGTGIGLALTRELVQIMHGTVLLKSLEGKGSVFIVSFMLGKEHLQESEYIIKEPGSMGKPVRIEHDVLTREKKGSVDDHKGIRILLVEDNAELRAFMVESLSPEFQVIEAENGLQALELVKSEIPDLLISDVMMPGMDGMELCKKVKHDELTSHIPVILLTARSTSQDRIQGFDQGADEYIVKPFRYDELRVRIWNLIEQRDRLKKKFSAMLVMDWEEITVSTLDEKFLKTVIAVISDHLLDPDFNVGSLHEKISMSREHLYRKLMAITGESPSSLIRKLRLKTAATLLQEGKNSITNISLHVGFSNPSHFARSFKKEYGITPNKYRKIPIS